MGATVFGKVRLWQIKWAVGCFLVAGACWGIIAANAAEYLGPTCEFFTTYILKIWGRQPCFLTFGHVSFVEHLSFWLGIAFVAFGFFRMKPDSPSAIRQATLEDRLEEIRNLRTKGLITDAEFGSMRANLLGLSAVGVAPAAAPSASQIQEDPSEERS